MLIDFSCRVSATNAPSTNPKFIATEPHCLAKAEDRRSVAVLFAVVSRREVCIKLGNHPRVDLITIGGGNLRDSSPNARSNIFFRNYATE